MALEEAAAAPLWKRLYEAAPPEEKIAAAAELIQASGRDGRTIMWVFEWLVGGGAVAGKRAVLPPRGIELLCELLEALAPGYPLGPHVPMLLLQLRSALDAAGGSAGAAAARPQAELSAVHARLASLLLARPPLSFRPAAEQVQPLFVAVAGLLARRVESGEREQEEDEAQRLRCAALPSLAAALAGLLARSLEGASPKKAFKALVGALPPSAALLAAAPGGTRLPEEEEDDAYVGAQAPSPRSTPAVLEGSLEAVASAVRALLQGLFDRSHLEGFETLVRATAVVSGDASEASVEPSQKRARKADPAASTPEAGGSGREGGGAAYQAALFSCIEGELSKPDAGGCAAVLPLLFSDFVAAYRRHAACRDAELLGDQPGGAEGAPVRKRNAAEVAEPKTPCEFCFFLRLSTAITAALTRGPGAAGDRQGARTEPAGLVQCLVRLWRLVRLRRIYRPREDPDSLQRRGLHGLVGLALRRLSAGSDPSAVGEWEGLLEALRLDPSPFEPRLEEVWGAIGDLSPNCVGGPDPVVVAASMAPSTRLAAELLRTYGRLADLPSCLAAAVRALRTSPKRRAARLVADPGFLGGLQAVAAEVSHSASASQATEAWEMLLQELRGEAGAAGGAWWAAALLEHLVRGLRATELSLQPYRGLLLRSFGALEQLRGAGRLPERSADGLLLAMCGLGRRLGAWELPVTLRQPEGDASALRGLVEGGLRRLAGLLASETWPGPGAKGSWEPYIGGAAQWLALCEEQWREGSGGQVGADGEPELTQHSVVAALFRRAAAAASAPEEADGTAMGAGPQLEARRAVCMWVPLFAALAERNSRDLCSHESRDYVEQLVCILVPAETGCWRHLARMWEHGDKSMSVDKLGKVWVPAAQLWAGRAELLVDHASLSADLLERLAGLISDAAELPAAAPQRQRRHRLAALVGLHEGLLRLAAAAALQRVPAPSLLAVFRALTASLGLACGGCSAGEEGPRRRLLPLALRCGALLLEALAADVTAVEGQAALEVVELFTCAGAGTRNAEGDQLPVLEAVAEVLARASLGAAGTTTAAEALARLACALLRQRCREWPAVARERWAGRLVCQLTGQGLVCSFAEAASGGEPSGLCQVSLPNPLHLLAQPGAPPGDTAAEGVLRALKLLVALLGTANLQAKEQVAATFRRAICIRLCEAAPQTGSHPACAHARGPGFAALQTAGLVLAVVAQAVELGSCLGDGKAEGVPSTRSELVGVVAGMVRRLQTGADADTADSAGAGSRGLRHGMGLLIHALCAAPWPDTDLWESAWLPLVADWAELSVPTAPWASAPTGPAESEAALATAGPRFLAALCAGASRERRDRLVAGLAERAAALAAKAVEQRELWLPRLSGLLEGVAVVLQRIPHKPTLPGWVVASVLAAIHAAQAVGLAGPGALDELSAAASLHVARMAQGLYVHLAAPLQRAPGKASQRPHARLVDAEGTLLHVAGLQARAALRLLRGDGVARPGGGGAATVAAAAAVRMAPELLAAAYSALSAMFSAVPVEGKRLPPWTKQPHIVLEVLKAMLEATYASPSGAQAARVAGDVTRLWEAYAQGGTRLVAQSAGRAGKSTYHAKIQRATKGFVIFLIAQALDQQRRWPGVEAATKRSLARLEPERRAEARSGELAKWKEVVSIVQSGMTSLLACLEGSEHLKQSLYAGLRDPLGAMFKELNESYQKRGRYSGEA